MTPLISVSPLQLGHKRRPIPSKATAINTDACSKGNFESLKSSEAAELFFAINCQKNNFSMSVYEIGSESLRQALIYSCLMIAKVTVFAAFINPS